MREIERKVASLNQQIVDATKNTRIRKRNTSKKEETNQILVFLQLSNGEKSYLEYIFKANHLLTLYIEYLL